MDTQLGVTVSLAQLHVGVDNQPGMEGVRKQSPKVAATLSLPLVNPVLF